MKFDHFLLILLCFPVILLQFEGKIVAPSMNEWVGDSFSWIQVFYVNGLTIEGDGGMIDGSGSTWWEKCRRCRRPTVFYLKFFFYISLCFLSHSSFTCYIFSTENAFKLRFLLNLKALAEFFHMNVMQSLRFHSCNGLTVKSLSMSNSPGAHISVNGCDGAFFSRININSPPKSPNTDGFDIAVSKHVVIEDSILATGKLRNISPDSLLTF